MKQKKTTPKSEPVRKRKFFVAGVGQIEAASVEEVQEKLNPKKAGEVGDGNK